MLPWFIQPTTDLLIYSVYVAVLILVIVIDIEHRLVLHVVTFPTTAFALLASFILTRMTFGLSIVGAATGFIIFFLLFFLGERLFGRGALGFGDVTLATMLGAMLGFQLIFQALVFGILLAGLWAILVLATRQGSRRSYFAYGPFLAISGIVMVIWGEQIYNWFTTG
jgi:leader peptidase (prepilin peptidase)/N-methyltransferase